MGVPVDPFREESVMKRGLGILLLAIYLVLVGLASLLNLSFPYQGTVIGLLALVAGLLLLVGR